ncbi:unnamed protein product, partial [marine sediment metagenome]
GFVWESPWGPSVPGLTEVMRSHSLLQVAAYQWFVSVSCALAFPIVCPTARYLELRYEELIAKPEDHIRHIQQFLGDQYDSEGVLERVNIMAGGYTWRELMSPEELSDVEAIAGHTLRLLGYQ